MTLHSRRIAVGGLPLFAARAAMLIRIAGGEPVLLPSRRKVRGRIAELVLMLGADCVIQIGGQAKLGLTRGLATAIGEPVIFQWVGSELTAHASRADDSIRSRAVHWAEVDWLRDELLTCGFHHVDVIVLNSFEPSRTVTPLPGTFTAVAYVPDSRPDFYGLDTILRLAEDFPEIEFKLAAYGGRHGLPPNVSALGWIDDVRALLSGATVLIRMTEHDGLSHMVLEALGEARYVIWTYKFPGAFRATTRDEAAADLHRLLEMHDRGALSANMDGRRFVLANYTPERAADRLTNLLTPILDGGAQLRWSRMAFLRGVRAAARLLARPASAVNF